MKHVSTFFLKIAVFLLGIPILVMCIFLVPEIANTVEQLLPDYPYLKYVVFVLLYGSVIPYYFALYQAFKLLRNIDRNLAFSQLSVRALKQIKYNAVAIMVLHLLVFPLFFIFAELDDAPGVIFVGLFVPVGAMVIAVFAAVLQRLLQEAIAYKEENELTV
ncbi:MAG TPA: DUF2975 domain-containing protein [Candidatus Paenibacillus intestinavium]|nr:DUF2975 domain-containing protein [Candidatus Paenibacillus intestinavium]